MIVVSWGARFVIAALALAPLAGCAQEPTVELKGQRYTVEIADSQEEQTLGRMFRRELDSGHGMLFTYDEAQPQSFWMKNCYIALDILYFDRDGKFINGHYNVPPCRSSQCPTYPSRRPARYVLELGGNVAKPLALEPGDALTLPR